MIAAHGSPRQFLAFPELLPIRDGKCMNAHRFAADVDPARLGINGGTIQQGRAGLGGPTDLAGAGFHGIKASIPAADENQPAMERRRIPDRSASADTPRFLSIRNME